MPDETLEGMTKGSLWSRYYHSEYGPTITTIGAKVAVSAGIALWALVVSDDNNAAIRDVAIAGTTRAVIEDTFLAAKVKVEHGLNSLKLLTAYLAFDVAQVAVHVGMAMGIASGLDAIDIEMPRLVIPVLAGVIGLAGLPYFGSVHHRITKRGVGFIGAAKQLPHDYAATVKKAITIIYGGTASRTNQNG